MQYYKYFLLCQVLLCGNPDKRPNSPYSIFLDKVGAPPERDSRRPGEHDQASGQLRRTRSDDPQLMRGASDAHVQLVPRFSIGVWSMNRVERVLGECQYVHFLLAIVRGNRHLQDGI